MSRTTQKGHPLEAFSALSQHYSPLQYSAWASGVNSPPATDSRCQARQGCHNRGAQQRCSSPVEADLLRAHPGWELGFSSHASHAKVIEWQGRLPPQLSPHRSILGMSHPLFLRHLLTEGVILITRVLFSSVKRDLRPLGMISRTEVLMLDSALCLICILSTRTVVLLEMCLHP